jgi:O-antigen/teichoic acid export membrane protein
MALLIPKIMQKDRSHNVIDTNSALSGTGVASIARNALYLLGSRWFNIAIRLIYAIVLAHYLGPVLYGFINYGISWYLTFLSVTGLGIAVILGREIGVARNSGAWIASLTFTLRIFVAIIAAVACGFIGWFIETKPEVKIILIVFSIALLGRAIAMWTEAIFNAYEVNRFTFRLQAVFRTFEVLAGTGLLLAGGGLIAVAVAHAISWWFQALSGLAITRRHVVAVRFNWSRHGLKHTVLRGIPIGLAFVMVNWLLSGPLVLFRHLGSSGNSLGQLALAIQSFVIIGSLPLAAGMASLPVLSRSVTRQDGKDIVYTETVIRAGLFFGAAVGLAGLGAGQWLVTLVFGTRYLEAGYLLGLVMWLLIPFTCGTTIGRVYFARGEYFLPFACSGIGALLMTLIMPWFVAAMNASGVVLATAIGMAVWSLSLIWLLARKGDLSVRQAILRPLAIILLALGVFFVLKSVKAWLALPASCIALLLATLQFGGVTEDERYLLKSLGSRWYSPKDTDSSQSGS